MKCLIAGCPDDARNKLSIRCRKPSTLNVWSPDLDAYLCKKHAEGGVELILNVEAAVTGSVEASVTSGGQQVTHRVTAIKKSAS